MIQSILTAFANIMLFPPLKVFIYLPMNDHRMFSWFKNISVAVAGAGVAQWNIIVALVDDNVDVLDRSVARSPLPSEMKERLTTGSSDLLTRTLVERAQRLFLRGRLPDVLDPILPFLPPTQRYTVTHLSTPIHQSYQRLVMNLHVDTYWETFQETCKQGLQHLIYTIQLDNEPTKSDSYGNRNPCQSWQDYTSAEKIIVYMDALMSLWNSNQTYFQHFILLFPHKGVRHVHLLYRQPAVDQNINGSLDERQWQNHAGLLAHILVNINTDSIQTLKLPFVRQNGGLPQHVMESFITLLQKVVQRKRVLDEICVPMFQLHTNQQLPPNLPDLLISAAKTIALGVVYIQHDVVWQQLLGSLLVKVLLSKVGTVSFVAPPTTSASWQEQRQRQQMIWMNATYDEHIAIKEKNNQRTFHIFGRGFPEVNVLNHITGYRKMRYVLAFDLPRIADLWMEIERWKNSSSPMRNFVDGLRRNCGNASGRDIRILLSYTAFFPLDLEHIIAYWVGDRSHEFWNFGCTEHSFSKQ